MPPPPSYYVCEKSDGIRYLLYLTVDDYNGETQYLIDRKNDYWWIPTDHMHLPIEGEQSGFHTKTVVDGELVLDTLADGTVDPKFLVFDCLLLDGKDLRGRTLDKRLAYFKEQVFKPYWALFGASPAYLRDQSFTLEMKDMQFSYGIEMMFRQVIPKLKHGNDGLIFTCCSTAYQSGTDPHILKWKPVTENTIDFRVRLHFRMAAPDGDDDSGGDTKPYPDYDAVPFAALYVYYGDGAEPYRKFADLYLSEDEWRLLKETADPVTNRIVECAMDEDRRWRLHRFRDDKLEANHISTVKSVMESIRDSVSEQELWNAAKGIKDSWKARHAEQKKG